MEIHIIVFSPKPAYCCAYPTSTTGRCGEKLVFLLCCPQKDLKQNPLQLELELGLLP